LAPDEPPQTEAQTSGNGWLSDPRIAIARRDLSSLTREKTIILALLIQLFIAAFSSFLVVGLTSLYDPGSVASGEIEVGVTGEEQQALLEAAADQEGVSVTPFDTAETARTAFDRGVVDAILTADARPTGDGNEVAVTSIVPAENLRTTLIVVQVRRLLTDLERTERIDRAGDLEFIPLDVPDRIDASPYFGFTYTVLIPLLLFLPPFISGSVAVDAITEEIERGTLELLRVAPVSLVDIVDGKAAAMILLAPLQAALWLMLLSLNGIAISHMLPLLALVTAIATVVVVLGIVLGLLTAKRRQAQLLYSILVIALFGAAVVLPEHPATTVAKLAVASPTATTFAHVTGFVVVGIALFTLTRRFAGGLDPERL
jgi:ABC-2 type transport system permease protein